MVPADRPARRGSPVPSQPPKPSRVVVTLGGAAAPDAICTGLRILLAELGPCPVDCDVAGVEQPDIATVDAIARVVLTARRLGCEVEVVGCSAALAELVAFAGLSRVIRLAPAQSSRGGRPKSGKKVSVSRKNVIPAMPSSERSRT